MDGGIERVLRDRRAITAHIEAQRDELARVFASLERPAAFVDRGVAALRYVRSRPLLIAAVVGAAVALRGRGVLPLLARGVGLWRMVRRAGGWLRALRS